MISLAQLILDRHDAGLNSPDEWVHLPGFQMEARFDELQRICPSRLELGVERRPANALNVEVGQPMVRCSMRSPDGRGLVWLRSGGSALAYGLCSFRACPRVREVSK